MENIKKAFNWLVVSSADPEQLALTVRGGLPLIILVAGLLKFHLDENDVVALVHSVAIVISGLVTCFGLVRKIALTSKSSE